VRAAGIWTLAIKTNANNSASDSDKTGILSDVTLYDVTLFVRRGFARFSEYDRCQHQGSRETERNNIKLQTAKGDRIRYLDGRKALAGAMGPDPPPNFEYSVQFARMHA